jgi:hypothetical protein
MGILRITLHYVTWLASCVAKPVKLFYKRVSGEGKNCIEKKQRGVLNSPVGLSFFVLM